MDAGGAILIPESALDVAAMSAQIEAVLSNPQAAQQMSLAALSVGVPDATERLVALVEQLAEEG